MTAGRVQPVGGCSSRGAGPWGQHEVRTRRLGRDEGGVAGNGALAVLRGLLLCAAQNRAVVEGLEVRRPGGQVHPAGVSNPKGRLGWSAGSQSPWDSLGEVPPRDGVLTAAALVWGCNRLEEQGWS